MRRFVLALVVAGSTMATAEASGIRWLTPAEGEKQQGKVVYYYRQSGASLCMIAEEDVWTDARVVSVASRVPCVLVDLNSESAAAGARERGVVVVPTVLLMENGREIGRLQRSVKPEEYVALIEGRPVAAAAPAATQTQSSSSIVEAIDPAGDASPESLDIVALRGAITAQGIAIELETRGPANTAFAPAYNLFFNTDGQENTGHSGEVVRGADFLVQGATVFRFGGAAQTEWAWEQIGMATRTIEGNKVRVQIPAALVPPSPAPLVQACSQNEQWTTIDWAPDKGSLSLAPGSTPAAPAAPVAVGGGTTFTDTRGDATGAEDIVEASIQSTGDALQIRLTMAATATIERQHVFFDMDRNETTGYSDGARSGADFMIEGATLYRHKTESGTAWDWQPLGPAEARLDGNSVVYTIARSRVGARAGSSIRLWFTTTGSDWAPADYLPDSGTVEFSIPE